MGIPGRVAADRPHPARDRWRGRPPAWAAGLAEARDGAGRPGRTNGPTARRRPPRLRLALVAALAVAVLLPTGVLSGTVLRSQLRPSPSAAGAGPGPRVRPSAMAPLTRRADPALFVTAPRRLSAADLAALRQATGATDLVVVDAARVRLGHGETEAVGVDPAVFRTVTPAGTAEATALWESVARGDAAVAHTIARALGVPLGGRVAAGRRWERSVRVGALATTQLPGVGLVVDRSLSDELGLVPGGGAALVVPGTPDPVVLAAAARQAVPGIEASSLLSVVADRLLLPSSRPTTPATVDRPPPAPAAPAPAMHGPASRQTLSQRPSRPGPARRPGPVASAWARPADGPVTQGFGPHSRGGRHPGIDIGAPLGSPVRTAADGQVLYAGPARGFGNEIILQHDGGVETVYGHMRVLLVRSGRVRVGQTIALVGSEGWSTGPHLHFEVHVGDRLVDPAEWLVVHGALP